MSIKPLCSYLLLASLLWLSGCNRVPPAQHAVELSTQFGVEIRGGDPETFFVAPYQAKDAAIPQATMAEVGNDELDEALGGISDALGSYPAGFVNQLIDAVFVCGELKFDGIPAAATYGPRWLIVSATPDRYLSEGNYRSALLGVHHELSSLVYQRSPGYALQWSRLMPDGWQAAASYQQALARTPENSNDLANGFLRSYGKTSMENDFNTYAEMLFSDPQQLREFALQYPRVGEKLGVVISAYLALSPAIARYFDEQQLTVFAPPATTITFSFSPSTDSLKPTEADTP